MPSAIAVFGIDTELYTVQPSAMVGNNIMSNALLNIHVGRELYVKSHIVISMVVNELLLYICTSKTITGIIKHHYDVWTQYNGQRIFNVDT